MDKGSKTFFGNGFKECLFFILLSCQIWILHQQIFQFLDSFIFHDRIGHLIFSSVFCQSTNSRIPLQLGKVQVGGIGNRIRIAIATHGLSGHVCALFLHARRRSVGVGTSSGGIGHELTQQSSLIFDGQILEIDSSSSSRSSRSGWWSQEWIRYRASGWCCTSAGLGSFHDFLESRAARSWFFHFITAFVCKEFRRRKLLLCGTGGKGICCDASQSQDCGTMDFHVDSVYT
mmetsp:Transcript_46357/g.112380  ORF Transcript_46357/g.112380 Transcript_46357/m.112380 type:complete len:231 (-) Transcript_46357:63-755(-)